ncbi:MAG TPA: AMP-binding protein [Sphingomonas sp.]|uniref:AMP-binding protein n=1 Tax=Sphingomonas sp. TaxID=28214 RepID=UPI002C732100|nr:AMP-binding protein [Sphingomonas sp.]HMI18574.1 AMP-binding protein [Sphingomonas sp.]
MIEVGAVRVIALQKVSSPAYLHQIFAAWRARDVIVPTDDPATLTLPHWPIAERLMVEAGGGWFDESLPLDDDPAPAQISFTSGTTGTPKPILLSRRALSDVTRRLNDVMRIDDSIREYVGVPVTFSFGLGRARAIAAVGGKAYLPPNGFRPDELADMLMRGEVNALSAVPTLLRILIQQSDLIAAAGPKLKWLEIGSQYMSAEEKTAVRALFPKARIVQHYGLTEASRTTFLVVSDTKGAALESVGQAEAPDRVRIDGEGRIAIRGPHVADGILTETGVTPIADADGWLTTNDLGAIDAQGFVHFRGRSDHLLNVSGIKVPAELFEQRLAEALGPDGAKIAVAARKDPLRGEAVLVCHLPGVAVKPLQDKARAIALGFGLGAADVSVTEVPSIPRTDTGKVRRGEITDLYGAAPAAVAASSGAGDADDDGELTDREREIAAIWTDALGVSPIGKHESFFDIGGDSLSAITVMIKMERAGVPKSLTQQIFEGRTIAEIAADAEATDQFGVAPGAGGPRGLRAVTTDAISMTRAVLVMLVIVSHWSPFLFGKFGPGGMEIYHWLVPIFRAGTPGFAVVFGVGLGYFQAPVARKNPERLTSWRRTRVAIIGGAILVLGVVRTADLYLHTGGFDAQWPTELFFGVLCFYLLMVLTAPEWLRLIGRARYPIVAALVAAAVSYLLSALFSWLWIESDTSGFVNFGRLLLVTRYSYPEMLGHAMVGLAIGLWIGQNDQRPDLARAAAWGGAAILLGGLVLSLRGDVIHWFDNVASLPQVLTYAGGALLVFSVAFARARRQEHAPWARRVMRILIVIGLLALPAYVGHEGVTPVTNVLTQLGLRPMLAIGLPVLAFVGGMLFAMQRVYRLYYRESAG